MSADTTARELPEPRLSAVARRLAALEGWAADTEAVTKTLRATGDRSAAASDLLRELTELRRSVGTHADVILFRASGKFYTEEQWAVPSGAIGPYDMDRSPDFRRISDGGAVLVTSQRWGYPHLFPGVDS